MVESKFTLFEMEKEIFAANAAALGEARLRRAPKAFDAVDVDAAAANKDAVAMFDAKMFAVSEVHQSVVADPAVGMNDARQGDATANNGPQSGLFCVGHDLRVDAALAVKDAEDDGLAAGAAAPLAANPAPPEVRFVDFDRAADRRMLFALAGHANANGVKVAVDGAPTNVRKVRHFRGFQIEGKEPHDLAKFGLRNMRTANIAIEGRQY